MLQASLFQEQDTEEKLPDSVIVDVSFADVVKQFKDLKKTCSTEEALRMTPTPIDAVALNILKEEYGIETILRRKFNVVNAIKAYGYEWLEK